MPAYYAVPCTNEFCCNGFVFGEVCSTCNGTGKELRSGRRCFDVDEYAETMKHEERRQRTDDILGGIALIFLIAAGWIFVVGFSR